MHKLVKIISKTLATVAAGIFISIMPSMPVWANTVSTDPLPTVQIDGIVYDEAVYGNRVYATGQFNYARPAGSPVGYNETSRSNLLAFDVRTGELVTNFNHSLNGTGWALSVSPDGKRLYVGGTFTQVDGQYRSNLAAFDTTTPSGKLLPGFSGTDGRVKALAATNGGVFIGGSFANAYGKSMTDGYARQNLAAYAADGSVNPNWSPTVSLGSRQPPTVWALLALTDKVVIAGAYDHLNGKIYYGSGAVSRYNGVALPWASQSSKYPIRYYGRDSAMSSLSTDGKQIYETGIVNRSANTGKVTGTMEGRAAVSAKDGSVIWVNGCYGDSYDAIPLGGILFSVSHAHDCSAIGTFSQGNPHHVLAETIKASASTNKAPTTYRDYGQFVGIPDSVQLDWYPELNTGNVSGAHQAAWAITGAVTSQGTYIVLGGEFTQAGGVNQQGLVRYSVGSLTN